MPVEVVQSFCIKYNDRSFVVPEKMLTTYEGKSYMNIAPYCASLVRLIWPQVRSKNPSFAGSEVLKELQKLRAEAIAPPEPEADQDDLFDGEQGPRPRRVLRLQDQLATFNFRGVTLTCPALGHLGQRQQIALPLDDPPQLEAVFDALADETFENNKRPYAKKAKTEE